MRHSAPGLSLAVMAVLSAAVACGPPQQPRRETDSGPLGYAIAEAERASRAKAGVTGAVKAPRAIRPAPATAPPPAASAPVPYIVIRFDRSKVVYEDALYSALSRALERWPAAVFDVVLAMPSLPPKADAEEASSRGERRLEGVVLLMADMGLPPERVNIAATTDAAAAVDEVRIYVR